MRDTTGVAVRAPGLLGALDDRDELANVAAAFVVPIEVRSAVDPPRPEPAGTRHETAGFSVVDPMWGLTSRRRVRQFAERQLPGVDRHMQRARSKTPFAASDR